MAIPIAIWLPSPADVLSWLWARSSLERLLLGLVLVLLYGTLGTAGSIAAKRWFQPVLRDARRIGPSGSVSPFRLIAVMTSVGEFRRRIILSTLAFLASVIASYLALYLSPSSPHADWLVVMAVAFALFAILDVAALVLKLTA
jgi:hypothetical protein